jgi:hypothetical protein
MKRLCDARQIIWLRQTSWDIDWEKLTVLGAIMALST